MSDRLTVNELEPGGTKAWDAFVDACPDANFYQRAGWKEVIEKTFGHRCYFLQAERDGKITGVLPLVLAKSLIFGKSLVSTGFTVGGGPAVLDREALAALDARAIEIAEQNDRMLIHSKFGEKSIEIMSELFPGIRLIDALFLEKAPLLHVGCFGTD